MESKLMICFLPLLVFENLNKNLNGEKDSGDTRYAEAIIDFFQFRKKKD